MDSLKRFRKKSSYIILCLQTMRDIYCEKKNVGALKE